MAELSRRDNVDLEAAIETFMVSLSTVAVIS
jgi:hypothetical protein